MKLQSIIAGLLQPLFALLLIAGLAQAAPCLFDEGDRIRVVESSLEAISVLDGQSADTPLATRAALERSDDDHGPGMALPAVETAIGHDRVRLVETSYAAYSPALLSHWPCAAPSTGPPLA